MLFSEGTKVRFKNTGDEGVITSIIDAEMVNVFLDEDDMEIPAFIENLERVQDTPRPNQSIIKAKFVQSKKSPQPPSPPNHKIDPQYFILKSLGIQLAFEPHNNYEGITSHYDIYLINDTRYDALYSLTIDLAGMTPKTINGKIENVSYINLGEMKFNQLNDAPIFDIDIWQLTTVGTGYKMSKTLKLKPKQFFKNIKTVPLLDKQMHWYQLFENFDREEKTEREDLKSYTQKNARKPKKEKSIYHRYSGANPREFASFNNEIDLHIENLSSSFSGLSNAEILRIQLAHFDSFLEKALKIGVSRIFVIHGLGKGKLKNEIATRLIQHPHVKTFKNEYHPKYGFGATEVIF
ncbi:MAG: Smr/MutS family protein [Bacteroidota bacterium]